MAVVNGQTAEIFVGAQRFIRVEVQSYGAKLEKIQGVDVGTRISITPWTGGKGEITATISPEVSNIVELERATGLPTLSSRRASTTVRVKDGQTIAIGGLTQRQDYYTKRKVPILGDLPLVGPLFRSSRKNSSTTELVILITPRILADSGHLPDAAEESQIKTRMLGS
jgi:type II secretory pathway component GspD/PulD (secretin)